MGPLDVATALLSLRDGMIPPTANVTAAAAEYEMDLVTGQARAGDIRRVLVAARGHGGFNAAMVLSAEELTDDRERGKTRV